MDQLTRSRVILATAEITMRHFLAWNAAAAGFGFARFILDDVMPPWAVAISIAHLGIVFLILGLWKQGKR